MSLANLYGYLTVVALQLLHRPRHPRHATTDPLCAHHRTPREGGYIARACGGIICRPCVTARTTRPNT